MSIERGGPSEKDLFNKPKEELSEEKTGSFFEEMKNKLDNLTPQEKKEFSNQMIKYLNQAEQLAKFGDK